MERDEYTVYRRFTDKNLAEIYAEVLQDHGVVCFLDYVQDYYNVLMPNSKAPKEYLLKIKTNDSERVDSIFLDYEKGTIKDVDSDYYLYSFTNDELIDLITAHEEWSEYDYLLAQELLKERGVGVSLEQIKYLQEKRIEEISKLHKGSVFLIIIGYILAVFGGIVGIAIGYNYAYHKHVLPNSHLTFYYTPRTRRHGFNIFCVGIISFFIWVLVWFAMQPL